MRNLAIRLAITFWAFYALHGATNIVREVYLALSIGDKLSFDVGEYRGLHPDLFEIPGRGVYINNNPGASMVGAVPYLLARPVLDRVVDWSRKARAAERSAGPREYRTSHEVDRAFYREAWERGLDVKLGLAAGVMQALGMAPLSAFSVVLILVAVRRRTSSLGHALALAVLYGVGTPVLYRTAQLNQNLLVAHCALFAFMVLWRPWDDPSTPRPPAYWLAGFIGGWAVVADYTGLLVLAFVTGYAVTRRRSLPTRARSRMDLWWLGLSAAASMGVLFTYQWVCFGDPLLPAQMHMPATKFSELGFAGVTWPERELLWETAFGLRYGLFVSAPLLALALYPPAWIDARFRLVGGREAAWMGGFCLALFVFCGAIQYGRWQVLTGTRYLVPASPFLFLVAAGGLLRLPRGVAIPLGIATALWSWCLAMYRDPEPGFGALGPVLRAAVEGGRLPWLTTLERLGYVPPGLAPLVLTLFAALLIPLWGLHPPRPGRAGPTRAP